MHVKTTEDIQTDIEALPRKEYMKIVHWFSERDGKTWDKEIEMDPKSGKLDFLIEEELAEKYEVIR